MSSLVTTVGLFIAILLVAFLITGLIAYKSFAPWVPTRRRDIKRVLALADLKPGDVFYDLGCGDGRMVVQINKQSGAQAIGLEISFPLYLICQLRKLQYWRNKNIVFKLKNLFKEDLSAADVVYFFGIPFNLKNKKIKDKLKKELRPGTKVISYAFTIPGWEPEIVDRPKEKDTPIFVYEI